MIREAGGRTGEHGDGLGTGFPGRGSGTGQVWQQMHDLGETTRFDNMATVGDF